MAGIYTEPWSNCCAVQLMLLIQPFTHQSWLAAMQGTNQPVRLEQFGGWVFCSGTPRHAHGGIKPATLWLPDDFSYLLSHCFHDYVCPARTSCAQKRLTAPHNSVISPHGEGSKCNRTLCTNSQDAIGKSASNAIISSQALSWAV